MGKARTPLEGKELFAGKQLIERLVQLLVGYRRLLAE